MDQDLRLNLEEQHNVDVLPEVIRDSIWALAYEQGHAHGDDEISSYYAEYSEPIRNAYSIGWHRCNAEFAHDVGDEFDSDPLEGLYSVGELESLGGMDEDEED